MRTKGSPKGQTVIPTAIRALLRAVADLRVFTAPDAAIVAQAVRNVRRRMAT